jgi:hypothetical protein
MEQGKARHGWMMVGGRRLDLPLSGQVKRARRRLRPKATYAAEV